MGFGDKFKNLAKQAQDAVAEHKDQIQQAVEVASVAANEKTGGKYATKIAKVGEKANERLDKVGAPGDGDGPGAAPAGGFDATAGAGFDAPAAPAGPDGGAGFEAPAAPAEFDDDATASAPVVEAKPAGDDGFPSFD